MGYVSLLGMLEAEQDLDRVLGWHLGSNHYPPVPDTMIPVCKAALAACVEEDAERLLDLPEGILWQGQQQVPAFEVVESFHLHGFMEFVEEL